MRLDIYLLQFLIGLLDLERVPLLIELRLHLESGFSGGLQISFTITLWLISDRQRQFMLMWGKSRCSILCHLLVPGGK